MLSTTARPGRRSCFCSGNLFPEQFPPAREGQCAAGSSVEPGCKDPLMLGEAVPGVPTGPVLHPHRAAPRMPAPSQASLFPEGPTCTPVPSPVLQIVTLGRPHCLHISQLQRGSCHLEALPDHLSNTVPWRADTVPFPSLLGEGSSRARGCGGTISVC